MVMIVRKRLGTPFLALLIASVTALSACGAGEKGESNNPTAGSEGKSTVSVWYLWGGKEGEAIEEVI